MLNELNQRLATTKANYRRKGKLDSQLRAAQHALDDAKRQQANLKNILAKEQADVDALEGLSLTALFHAVLGSKEQKLQKERQELVAAKLKHDQVIDTVETLNESVHRLQDALSRIKNADTEYEAALAEKADYLAANGSDVGNKLFEVTQQIADLTADQKELDEANGAGHSALRAIEEIRTTLASAASWGTLDLFGGGMLTTMAKHSKIDSAKNQARTAQRKLLQFEEELADADQRLQISLQIDGFSKFADYFFDGLISDWIVQSKIEKARTECSKTISQVTTAIRQCDSRLKQVESEIETLTQRKRELIETA
ncbi:hypothetical protein [Rubripirellula reticaptiva]|uniref:Uncharacterized protein n=1 Tax=Rubripirellula reticaptiva TaxID=2528013 RepID=A0A5C6EPD7_9BACT|nr:hypothetical protein [Rubripirellula reticaptiva]TWU49229.1 hypothetical protein Poly59_38430 [Rubripirellula reticaptiva]